MAELAQRAARTGIAQLTPFLSPAEQAQADICARQAGVALHTDGGDPGAERRMAAFADADWAPAWPIVCVRATWNARYGAPGHRDLLGAVLALGIDREKVGDLYIGTGEAYIFALREMGQYIAANLTSAGRTPLRAQALDEWPGMEAATGEAVRVTVASARLDAVVAAIWDLSRGDAAALVASGRVQQNHRQELRGDRAVAEGDLLSARGFGRARVDAIAGQTKKGRIAIVILRY